MLGRGALANPNLPHQVAQELGIIPAGRIIPTNRPLDWIANLNRLVEWMNRLKTYPAEFILARLKQWLHMAARFGTFTRFDAIKRAKSVEMLFADLQHS